MDDWFRKKYINIIYMSNPTKKSKVKPGSIRNAKSGSNSKAKSGSTRKAKSGSTRNVNSGSKKALNKKPKTNKEENADNMEKIQQMWKSLFNEEDSNEFNQTQSHTDTIVESNIVPTDNKDNKLIIVLIHATWCGHCQRLMPEWQKMKESLNENELNNIQFEEIESAHINQRLPEISKIYMDGGNIEYSGFPTIGYIQDKQFKKYEEQGNATQLLNWIRNMK